MIGEVCMEWNVFRIDVNSRKVVEFNIFNHVSFLESCIKIAKKKHLDKTEFAELIRKELFYYFCCKFEYEIWIDYVFDNKGEYTRKVDIYQQVMMNFDKFIDYVWENKKELQKIKDVGC